LLVATAVTAVAGPVLIGILSAQQQTEKLTFEVASIRPADPDSRNVSIGFTPGGGVSLINVDLKQAIAMAYNIQCGKNCQQYISGGPGWINSQRFDIVAKASGEPEGLSRAAAVDRTRRRLQALLAERFQLVLRRETREMPVYALTIAKGGPKFKESTVGGENGGVRGERGHSIYENSRISMLVINLASMLGRHVTDRTGLNGRYDFTFDYTPDMLAGGMKGPGGAGDKPESAGPSEPSGPSIFTALQEQLGLKLESTRGPVEIFVIGRVEKPSEN
jgi:uncharacterized protein (TIGR03435 family)